MEATEWQLVPTRRRGLLWTVVAVLALGASFLLLPADPAGWLLLLLAWSYLLYDSARSFLFEAERFGHRNGRWHLAVGDSVEPVDMLSYHFFAPRLGVVVFGRATGRARHVVITPGAVGPDSFRRLMLALRCC